MTLLHKALQTANDLMKELGGITDLSAQHSSQLENLRLELDDLKTRMNDRTLPLNLFAKPLQEITNQLTGLNAEHKESQSLVSQPIENNLNIESLETFDLLLELESETDLSVIKKQYAALLKTLKSTLSTEPKWKSLNPIYFLQAKDLMEYIVRQCRALTIFLETDDYVAIRRNLHMISNALRKHLAWIEDPEKAVMKPIIIMESYFYSIEFVARRFEAQRMLSRDETMLADESIRNMVNGFRKYKKFTSQFNDILSELESYAQNFQDDRIETFRTIIPQAHAAAQKLIRAFNE